MTQGAHCLAPGWPGIAPRWTSSAKTGVGTALDQRSPVWFTLSHGILNEVYYPRLDRPCTRDMGLLVADGEDFFSEEKRDTDSEVSYLAEGVPLYRLVNAARDGRYRIEKEVLADPGAAVVLQKVRFVRMSGNGPGYHLFALLAPHLGGLGADNTAWVGDYKGTPMLFAEGAGSALALACSSPWLKRSAGYVGSSDGWQDISAHKRMEWSYERAERGNVALTGEVDMAKGGEFTLALAFGATWSEAGFRAAASLAHGFDAARSVYVEQWRAWLSRLQGPDGAAPGPRRLYWPSAMAVECHAAKHFPGGMIASLSIPWGTIKGDEDLGGYHLVWPRDLAEAAGGLLAAGGLDDACQVLDYLTVTQEADGHWPQNMWMDGTPYWNGVQLDEAAFPVLLADLALRHSDGDAGMTERLWPMVRRAARFIVCNGPVTQQDRWEEDPGYSPFTLAAEVAALLVASEWAARQGEPGVAGYLRATADTWNASIERWTYVTDTDLARRLGVDGYYVRIAPPETADAASPKDGFVPIKNRPLDWGMARADQVVSPDALALVRFGLRDANDPRIVNTIKTIDALLKVETPYGPAWYRYTGDGYGEHEDGRPFDGAGVGRLWPLLTGERAHYELAAGRQAEAERLLAALGAFANDGGMLPEQVWDCPDVPQHDLHFGRPTGSAMPLVWAHAEYLKLCRSLRDGCVFDLPPQTFQRYVLERTPSRFCAWRFNQKVRSIPAGSTLRCETLHRAVVHWSADGWRTVNDTPTIDTGIWMHVADLPTSVLVSGDRIDFTFYWPEAATWEGVDYSVTVQAGA